MTRLQTEFQRLYQPDAPAAPGGLIDAAGQVRAAVMELAGPADWAALSQVWQGVQALLGWPAPAIAVSGTDGLQLWFSLHEPLPAAQAQGLLQALVERWLPGLRPQRLRLWPREVAGQWQHAARVPALQADGSNWSAFIAHDLAPLFADSPALDLPPGDDGQASLLAPLAALGIPQLHSGLAELRAAAEPAVAEPAAGPGATSTAFHSGATAFTSPRDFLLAVMNDAAVPLALRIDAAKALLH
jgi:hypothetical protein